MLRFLSKLKGKSSKYCFDNLFFYGTKKEVPTLKSGKNQTKYDEESKSNQVTSPECEEVNAFTTYTSINLLTKIGLSLLLLIIHLFISYPESPLVFCRGIWIRKPQAG